MRLARPVNNLTRKAREHNSSLVCTGKRSGHAVVSATCGAARLYQWVGGGGVGCVIASNPIQTLLTQ